MARLSEAVKLFIVQELACYRAPTDVAAAAREQFGIDVDRRRIYDLCPIGAQRERVASKWRDLFDATRKRFLDDTRAIAVSHKAYRLACLDRMARRCMEIGNMGMAAQLLEQAAKEMGGAYTNRRELTGPGGRPISYEPSLSPEDRKRLDRLDGLAPDQLARLYHAQAQGIGDP